MKKKLPLKCPSCESSLRVSELLCPKCATKVCGEFNLPLLSRLDEHEQTFIIAFVKASGSLKDMAKAMGVSYPTMRNMLDALIEKLDKMTQS